MFVWILTVEEQIGGTWGIWMGVSVWIRLSVNSVWRRHFLNVGKFVLSFVEASSFLMNWVIVAVQGICQLGNWQVLSVWLTDTSTRSNPPAYFKLAAVKLIRGMCPDMPAFLQRPISDYLRILWVLTACNLVDGGVRSQIRGTCVREKFV